MSDDEYEIPLRDQRMFGSGLKRKRIQFVSSTQAQSDPTTSSRSDQEVTAAEKYLAIVLNKRVSSPSKAPLKPSSIAAPKNAGQIVKPLAGIAQQSDTVLEQQQLCDVCSKPVVSQERSSTHENSLVHQICLQHSHPPSHLDRGRKGLAVLQSYGWNPDERRGLGAAGEGRLYPVKAHDNPAKLGLGATVQTVVSSPKPVKLDAGQTRKAEKDAQMRKDRLRNEFYQDEKVQHYLGRLGGS